MVVLTGKFDGKGFVVDGIPPDLAPGTPVRVVVPTSKRPTAFAEMAAKAIAGNLPPDFAAQHEHYVKGTPKK
jgi:hypothetical protein